MSILVTGAAGQLGTEAVSAAAAAGHTVVGLGSAELDITDAARVEQVVASLSPAAIIHCAAYTAVDAAQDDRETAMLVNGQGATNVAEAARRAGAYLISVSTDYVFDGTAAEGYAEADHAQPVNVYGESKLATETATLALEGAGVARTSWLFGRTGANFVKTIAGLAASRDAIDVVQDQIGCPTYAPHLADALVKCAEQRLAGIVHLVGSPVATWFDLAQAVVTELGLECEVRPTTSDKFVRPAPRPACSILRVTRADTPSVGDWHEGVREVVADLRAQATA